MRRRLLTVVASLVLVLPLATTLHAPSALAWASLGCKWSTSAINFYVPSPLISWPVWGNAAASWNGLDAQMNFNTHPEHLTGTNENRGNTVVWSGVTRQVGTVQDFPSCVNGFWVSGQMEVVLNYGYVASYSNAKRQGVAAHELGHAFGLAHTSSPFTLMYPTDARFVTSPSSDERTGVNALY